MNNINQRTCYFAFARCLFSGYISFETSNLINLFPIFVPHYRGMSGSPKNTFKMMGTNSYRDISYICISTFAYNSMAIIHTSRLRLQALKYDDLLIWHRQGRAALEKHLGLIASSWQIEPFFEAETLEALQHFWIPMVQIFPWDFMWYSNWEIILVEENRSIGGIGLSGLPDDNGATMVGYFIDTPYRNQGFASEALSALISWAKQDQGLHQILADTPLNNITSEKVLLKNGFQTFGEIEEVEHIEKIRVKHWILSL